MVAVIVPTLTATTTGGGGVTIQPPDGAYFSNSTAVVTASPADGWTFLQWLGDATGTNSTTSLRMTRNRCAEAVFGTQVKTATVGNGSVWQSPVAPFYPYGSQARFSGLPAAGSYLAFWGNAANSTSNPLDFLVTNASPTVTAVFQPLGPSEFALALVPDGRGSASNYPAGNNYSSGASVQLTAVSEPGQAFLGWSGDAIATQNPLTVTMNQNKAITANFTKRPSLRVGTPLEGWSPDGFRLSLTGEFGALYTISGSANLRDWATVGTVTNTYGTVQLTDPGGTNAAYRFYRAASPGP